MTKPTKRPVNRVAFEDGHKATRTGHGNPWVISDGDENRLIGFSAAIPPTVIRHVWNAYQLGYAVGKRHGRSEIQCELRKLIGAQAKEG